MMVATRTTVEKNSTIVFPLPFEIMRVVEGIGRQLEAAASAILANGADSCTATTATPGMASICGPTTFESAER
jgi:hypothetical protein